MPLLSDAEQLRMRLVSAAEFLHNLWRVDNNLDSDAADLTNEITRWEKIVDDHARELVAALNLQISPSEPHSGSSSTK